MTESKKVVFAPGCFDGFEGTQEELDEFVALITQMAESGELEANSTPIDEAVWNELSLEDREAINNALAGEEVPRRLN